MSKVLFGFAAPDSGRAAPAAIPARVPELNELGFPAGDDPLENCYFGAERLDSVRQARWRDRRAPRPGHGIAGQSGREVDDDDASRAMVILCAVGWAQIYIRG